MEYSATYVLIPEKETLLIVKQNSHFWNQGKSISTSIAGGTIWELASSNADGFHIKKRTL